MLFRASSFHVSVIDQKKELVLSVIHVQEISDEYISLFFTKKTRQCQLLFISVLLIKHYIHSNNNYLITIFK